MRVNHERLSYSDLKKLYDSGEREVYVTYALDKWPLPLEDLQSGMHTIIPYSLDHNQFDLMDEESCTIGCLEQTMQDEEIFVYKVGEE